MTLLRPQHSLHYRCRRCAAEFRFHVISGPTHRPHLAIALFCALCGHDYLTFIPDAQAAKGSMP